jgi:hypothetical protein
MGRNRIAIPSIFKRLLEMPFRIMHDRYRGIQLLLKLSVPIPKTLASYYPLHPTNRNDLKNPVRILTITLSHLRIHVWSYHQKLDSLQSKIISLSRVVSDFMGPLGRRILRRQKCLALPRYLVAYWICPSSHFRRVWSNFFQKQASQKSKPVHSVL